MDQWALNWLSHTHVGGKVNGVSLGHSAGEAVESKVKLS